MIRSLTSTNAEIQLKGDTMAELLNVSQQRLSLCKLEMSQSIPWIGHSGKLRKQRRVRQRKTAGPLDPEAAADSTHGVSSSIDDEKTTVTRSGRQVKKPARFHLIEPQVHSQNEGEDVRHDLEKGDHMSEGMR